MPANAAQNAGVFMIVKGKIFVTGSDGKTKKARMGMKVFLKDIIEAKDRSRAKIVMIDKNVLNISPKSKIQLADYKYENNGEDKNVTINLIYGKIRSKVKQKYDGKKNAYRVKTKAAVAGVRGTDFIVGHTSSGTQVVTFEGQVEVGNGLGSNGIINNPVRVRPGEMTSVKPNALPAPPVKVPEAQLKNLDIDSNADSADSDSTEANASESNNRVADKKDAASNEEGAPDQDGKKANNEVADQNSPDADNGQKSEQNDSAEQKGPDRVANNPGPNMDEASQSDGKGSRNMGPNAGMGPGGPEMGGPDSGTQEPGLNADGPVAGDANMPDTGLNPEMGPDDGMRDPASGGFMPPPPPPMDEMPVIGDNFMPPPMDMPEMPDYDTGIIDNPILEDIIQEQNTRVNIIINAP